MLQVSRRPTITYEVTPDYEDWVLGEDKVPESRPHDIVADRIKALLVAWTQRTGRRAVVCRNLAIRWDEDHPAIGVDPDVCVVEPPPPEGDEMLSLRLWETGHFPPRLAVEIVSASRADKDYSRSPEKYAANGTPELWVFDPKLAGPKRLGGPYRFQVWRRDQDNQFRRVYAGEGPVWSEAVKGWLFATEEGRSLRIADDEEGTSWWMTHEETERVAKEAAEARAALMAEKLRALGVDPDSLK